MNDLGMVYPHFWVATNFEALFPLHLEVIMPFYYVPQIILKYELLVVAPFDKLELESQASLFKTTMLRNVFKILKKDGKKCNHLRCMWLIVLGFNVFILGISKSVKLAKLAMCQVLGFVENEHCFSTLSFMKGKFCNRLITRLDVCVRIFSQDFHNLECFPYTKAIVAWKEKKAHHNINV
jgi:hypothetical protein